MDNFQGTIKLREDFDPERAAVGFRKAMKGMGSDSDRIINILVSHQNIQRQEIIQKYKEVTGRSLIVDLKDELGGTFEEAVVALLTPPYDLLVGAIHDALSGVGTDEKALIDTLCCRSAEEIEDLRQHYKRKYKEDLDEKMESDLSGDFQALMRSLVAAGRDTNQTVDAAKAKNDAQTLYDAGVGQNSGTDEEDFIMILNNRSFPQLQETFNEYQLLAGHSMEEALEKEFSGDMLRGLLGIVQRVRDPYAFYADRLNKTMVGAGTDDKTLIRLIVSRSEIDLEAVKEKYKEMYDTELAKDVEDDTMGDYRKLLLSIIAGKLVTS